MLRNRVKALLLCAPIVLVAAMPRGVAAQTALPSVAIPPTNVLLTNYTSVPIGEVAGLEAGAFVARADDSSSVFYNPAGLTRAEKTSVSGTAGLFQFANVGAENFDESGRTFQQVPAMFALVLKNFMHRSNMAAGVSVARTIAWNQKVDFARTVPSGSAVDRYSYSSAAQLDTWLASGGVGYDSAGRWRVGGSMDLQFTSMERRQALADQYRTAGGLTALSINSRSEAWASHLRGTAGAQLDLTPDLSAGVVVRSNGLGIRSSGLASLEGLSSTSTTTTTASFFDDDPDVKFKIPLEFRAGLAYARPRGAIEFDLLVYGGAGEYRAFETTQPITVVTGTSNGTAPSVTEYQAEPSRIDSEPVVNVAIGGHLNLTSGGAWTVHGGYGTDRSPVGSNDTTFTRAHLQKITAGISGRTTHFLGSVGVQYLTGRSDAIALRELPAGPLSTTFSVGGLGVMYSLSVIF